MTDSRRPRSVPGIELEPTLVPSRRHPTGAARCQAVTWRDGQPRQCRRKARDGFRVCGHHGAGYRKRCLLRPECCLTGSSPVSIWQQLMVNAARPSHSEQFRRWQMWCGPPGRC